MITADHMQAIQELLKLVQSKMGGEGEGKQDFGDVAMPEGEIENDAEGAEELVAEQEGIPKSVQEVEAGEDGLDPSIIEDMKQKFSGREDLNMPADKKGVRMGVTEISAMPMKKPMRR